MTYVDLAAFKEYLRIPAADTTDDVELLDALNAATSALDHLCSRTFEVAGAASTRYFQPWYDARMGRWVLPTDDVQDTTGYVVNTWDTAANAYSVAVTFPGNPWRPLNPTATRPYNELILPPGVYNAGTRGLLQFSGWSSDENADYVAVTAKWGWSAVPASIVAATKLQASRWFKRRDAPFGLVTAPDGSENTRLMNTVDVDVQVMVRGFVKYWAAR
jgi:hypothetical protein